MNEPKKIGQRIKIARLLTNLTRKEFCEKYKINAHTLLSLETGRLSLSEKKTKELIIAFMHESVICTANWILEGKGAIPRKLQDIHNIERDGQALEEVDDIDEGISIFKEIEVFSNGSKNAFVTIINDDAMLPFYNVGDYVGGCFLPKEKIGDLSGEFCIVELKKDTFLVRHLFKEGDRIVLSGSNPKCKLSRPLIATRKIMKAAKVIWHRCQS